MSFSAFRSQRASLARLCRTGAAAWVMVLTILFCALLPAGLPHTASQGSAFNPATTSVALAAKAPERRATAEQRVRPDPGDAKPVLASLALLPASGMSTPSISWHDAAPLPIVEPAIVHAQAFARVRQAREPPAA